MILSEVKKNLSRVFTRFFLNFIYPETHKRYKDGSRMLYRNHQEYHQPPRGHDLEILRSWLKGETGTEGLKAWLNSLYDQ